MGCAQRAETSSDPFAEDSKNSILEKGNPKVSEDLSIEEAIHVLQETRKPCFERCNHTADDSRRIAVFNTVVRKQTERLNLENVQLPDGTSMPKLENAGLVRLNLNRGIFASVIKSNLDEARLKNSTFRHMENSEAKRAQLQNTNFVKATVLNSSFVASNMDGADFSMANLKAVSFNHASLSQTDFSGAKLEKVTFFSVKIFEQMDLRNSVMKHVSFKGQIRANVAGADVASSNIHLVKGNIIYDKNTKFAKGFEPSKSKTMFLSRQPRKDESDEDSDEVSDMDLSTGNLEGKDLSRKKFKDGIDFEGVKLKSCKLDFVDLRRQDLKNADLSLASMACANLTGADLSRANLKKTNLSRALYDLNTEFSGSLPSEKMIELGPYRKMNGANLSNCPLDYMSFQESDLVGANFRGATLKGADFRGADLTKANFEGADLSDASFEGAILDGAKFSPKNDALINLRPKTIDRSPKNKLPIIGSGLLSAEANYIELDPPKTLLNLSTLDAVLGPIVADDSCPKTKKCDDEPSLDVVRQPRKAIGIDRTIRVDSNRFVVAYHKLCYPDKTRRNDLAHKNSIVPNRISIVQKKRGDSLRVIDTMVLKKQTEDEGSFDVLYMEANDYDMDGKMEMMLSWTTREGQPHCESGLYQLTHTKVGMLNIEPQLELIWKQKMITVEYPPEGSDEHTSHSVYLEDRNRDGRYDIVVKSVYDPDCHYQECDNRFDDFYEVEIYTYLHDKKTDTWKKREYTSRNSWDRSFLL